jgi:vitamin B12 transporter
MFKPQYTPLALIIGSLISPASFADETIINSSNDDIVISASRVETKRVATGSSVTVIDEQYLKQNQNRTVAEILQDIPGVNVANTGGLGKSTSVFIRGADSNKTLVVIDGVEVNDLSNISGGYGFQNLMANNIERIEVLRGSQSALWGSDAIGGVINIITKQGKSGFNPTASVEFGENNYHKENINISGAQGDTDYSLSVTNLETDGISARDNESDDDSYENKSITLKAGHQFTNIFAMDTLLRYADSESEYDDYSGTASDSGYYSTNEQYQAKVNSHLNLLNNQWQNRLSVGLSNSKNEDFSYSDTSYEGKKITTELQSDYNLQPVNDFTQRLSFFAEHENENYQSWAMDEKERIEATGIVLGYGIDWQKLVFINAAIRHDFNNKFDDTTTYHLDASGWINEGTRLHSSYGTGVKNPTLGQLYGEVVAWSYSGNSDLTPEKSRSWDFGVEYNFSDVDAYVDLTYFDSRYTNMIDYYYDSTTYESTYVNLDDEATARGLEFTGSLNMTQDFRLDTSYTYMKTDDGDGNELSRRPEHSASINANYKYTPKLSANIGFRYVGTRIDSDDSELDSYMLTNIAVAYQVHKHIGLSARLENAFNENYEEVSGYNTDDRTIYVGVNFK